MPFQIRQGRGDMISQMHEIQVLVDRRAEPGILILNQEGETVYKNRSAFQIVDSLPREALSDQSAERSAFSKMLLDLYAEFKHRINTAEEGAEASASPMNRLFSRREARYLLRSIPLRGNDRSRSTHLMVLIEPVSQRPPVDDPEPLARLTAREKKVVQLLFEGKTNKEAAVCMGISEYTVKEYIKQIMRKFNVSTRAAIVAKSLSGRIARF